MEKRELVVVEPMPSEVLQSVYCLFFYIVRALFFFYQVSLSLLQTAEDFFVFFLKRKEGCLLGLVL